MVTQVKITTYDKKVRVKFGSNDPVELIENTSQDFHIYPGIVMTAEEIDEVADDDAAVP